jgi:hypothetical protein
MAWHDPIVSQDILNSITGKEVWNVGKEAAEFLKGNWFNGVCRVGLIIGGIATVFEFLIIAYKMVQQQLKVNPMVLTIELLFRIVILSLLLNYGGYQFFVVNIIAGPADGVANAITESYHKDMAAQVMDIFKKESDSGKNGTFLFNMIALNTALVSTIFKAVIFLITKVFLFIMPFLQKAIFLLVVGLGPICLGFMLNSMTSKVTQAWLSLALTAAWMGPVGSMAMLIQTKMHILEKFKEGSSASDLLPMFCYGVSSIFLLLAAWPVTSFLFGSISGLGVMTNPAQAAKSGSKAAGGAIKSVVGGASMAVGGATAVSGLIAKGLGSAMSKSSSAGMQSAGERLSSASQRLGSVSSEMLKTGAKFSMQGMQGLSSAITGSNAPNTPKKKDTKSSGSNDTSASAPESKGNAKKPSGGDQAPPSKTPT